MALLKRIIAPALLALICAGLSAKGLSLLDRNPFIWPGFEASPAPGSAESNAQASSEDFEFHAVYELSGTTHVLLKDRRKNAFHWVSIGESLEGLLAKGYDREKDQILLAYDDQERWLSLQELPEVSGSPVSAQPQRRTTPVRTTRSTSSNTSRSSGITRRSVVRPRTSTTAGSRTSIRSSSDSSPPSRAALLRSRIRQAVDPGVSPPNFTPAEPGPPPTSEPPENTPGQAPSLPPTGRP